MLVLPSLQGSSVIRHHFVKRSIPLDLSLKAASNGILKYVKFSQVYEEMPSNDNTWRINMKSVKAKFLALTPTCAIFEVSFERLMGPAST